ncbi:MAG: molybdopterin molybdotransferase MoeA [Proteobacteria bacterium]|nr:molybdopterin molybdotransferase MoeA [Pseudomonadota bacterium]
MAELLALDAALTELFTLAAAQPPLAVETVPTLAARHRVLAADLVSALAVPPADNSAMDGYAVRAAEARAGAVLPVSQRIAAGHVGTELLPGTAARIFTGAPIPAGADTVVMQEHTVAGDATVTFTQDAQADRHIRRAGEDIAPGQTVLAAGARLTPAGLGVAASVGAATLAVRRRLRVALLCTGDELTQPGEPLAPGAIYNSNRYTLRALLETAGCEVSDLGNVPDDLPATLAALREASACDVIVTSGGVSVGDADHLRPAVQQLGRLHLWKLAIKPGKPLAVGQVGAALYFGLPGNPAASFATFLVVVAPVLRALQGMTQRTVRSLPLRAAFDWPRPDARREFLRVRVDADGAVALFPHQGSGVLTSAVWADGLVDVPPGQAIARGDAVRFLSMADLLAT